MRLSPETQPDGGGEPRWAGRAPAGAGGVCLLFRLLFCLLLCLLFCLGGPVRAAQDPTPDALPTSSGDDRPAPALPDPDASHDAAGNAAEALVDEPTVTEVDREHWSFQPLRRPLPPDVQDREWVRNPVDRFVLRRLEAVGLRPMPPAGRRVLIRRLTFDLTGLPPTGEQVEQFVRDDRPDAYERLVDRLLASPEHGEHAAQFWLDLARFAETDGFEHDKLRPDAWRYRDWVIAALNRDLPFDRFVALQLAGDQLRPDDPQARTATMFCLAGPDMPDINSQEERRHNLLNEITATVGSVLLGLQLGCAQCHDHKYDPLSQADFYRLRAVFEPAVAVRKNQSLSTLSEAAGAAPPTHLYLRGDWRRPGPVVQPAFPRVANRDGSGLPGAAADGSRGWRLGLARWLTRPDHPLTHRVLVNRIWQQHFGRGLSDTPSDFGVMGDSPSHPELLDWLASELIRRDFSVKAIRRLLVTSATYRQASSPATACGTPERAAAILEQSMSRDPANRRWSRYPIRRLRGEVIRDSMFALSGTLQRRAGGPGVRPDLPAELVATLLKDQWTPSPQRADHYRRGIYIFARRNLRYPIFEVFDRPAANSSCPQRNQSTTAPQALLMLNSEMSLDAARRLAAQALADAGGSPSETVGWLFRQVYGRPPEPHEMDRGVQFLEQQARQLRQDPTSDWQAALPEPWRAEHEPPRAVAVTDLCLAMFNSNEFLYLD